MQVFTGPRYDTSRRSGNAWDDGLRFSSPDQRYFIGQMQHEFSELLHYFRAWHPVDPIVAVEIGIADGGTLEHWVRLAPAGSLVIGVDSALQFLPGLHVDAGASGNTLYTIRGASRDMLPIVQRIVRDVAGRSAIDFLFIDGDHGYEAARSDFELYGGIVAPGGHIVFHDIVPNSLNPEIEVPRLWNEIREAGYRTRELVTRHNQNRYGIGVVYADDHALV